MGDGGTAHGLTTVAFVDVEGSTALLDRVGDRSGLASVARQLEGVSELVGEYGGQAVKSTGDGMLITFSSPRQAVLFGVASQRRLGGSAPKVRIGINTGEADLVDGDPFGAAVNAAARIAARAAGGEVLVSDVVRLLTGSPMPVRFVDRGRCRLRGFNERWHLWAVEEGPAERARPTTIGRSAELVGLDDLVVSTAAGEGRVVLVEGEAGIGKTHLVGETVARAGRAGIIVVEVATDEVVRQPGAIPRGLVVAAPDRLAARARLAGLLAVDPGRVDIGDDLGYAVTEAAVELIEELARSKPVLLVVEDLHWADDLSIKVLTAITARAAVSRFGVLASLRPTPRPPMLDRFVERVCQAAGTHLGLDALDALDVQALASAITGAPPGDRLRRRLEATGGNPLYVTELLRSMDDDGALRVDAGVVEVFADETPADLHETLVRRLSWLPPETNEALRIASLLGGAFTLHDVAAITARSVVDIAGALRDAALAGLVVGDADRLSFRHELVRESVYHHMLPAERRELHRAAARSLASIGAPTQQVAEQFARGALPGDADAVDWLQQAADEVRTLEPAGALSMLERAAALALAPAQPALRVRTIEPLVMLNRLDEAEAVARDVLGGAPPDDLEYAALRGQLLVDRARGAVRDALATIDRAVAAPGAPADECRRLLCMSALYSTFYGDVTAEDGQRTMLDLLAEARAAGDLPSECVARQGLGMVAMAAGHVATSQDHLTTAIAQFDSGCIPAATFVYSLPHTLHAFNLLSLDDIDGAIAAADRIRTQFDGIGAVSPVPLALGVSTLGRFCAGRWDDAIADAEAVQSLLDENARAGAMIDAVLARIACHRGDIDAARGHLSAGDTYRVAGGSGLGTDWLFMTRAELLNIAGRPEEAFDIASACWEATAQLRYMPGNRWQGVLLVQLALAVGRKDVAGAVLGDLEEGARRTPAESAIGAALRSRGLIERDPMLLLAAVKHYRRTPLRHDLAACCEDAAGALDGDRRDEAVALLTEATTIYAELDAAFDSSRVDAALRRLGVRPRRAVRVRATFGWESLTPMESDVVALVGDGLTNPEVGARLFISRRTVESHLSHVFRKLDVRNRTQLVAALVKRDG